MAQHNNYLNISLSLPLIQIESKDSAMTEPNDGRNPDPGVAIRKILFFIKLYGKQQKIFYVLSH